MEVINKGILNALEMLGLGNKQPQQGKGLLSSVEGTPSNVFYNPGNVERNQDWAGAVANKGYGTKDRFAVFDSPQMGLRALMMDVRTKIKNHNGDLSKMISQYAPKSENPTQNYYQYVRNKVGSDKVTANDLQKIVKAIVEFENKPGSELSKMYLNPQIFDEAVQLSTKQLPKNTSLDKARLSVKGVK
jgi:hypothetical protein